MERVMLTFPPELLAEVDEAAKRSGKNRSQLVRLALQDWLQHERRQEFERLLAEGYRAMAQQACEIVAESLPAQYAAAEGIWHWDE